MTVGPRQPEAPVMTRSMTAQAIVRQEVSPGTTNHLCPAPDFLERPFQQVGRAQSLLQLQREGEVDRQGGQIVGQTGRGRAEFGAELADQDAQ
jgi:hypothetical protein